MSRRSMLETAWNGAGVRYHPDKYHYIVNYNSANLSVFMSFTQEKRLRILRDWEQSPPDLIVMDWAQENKTLAFTYEELKNLLQNRGDYLETDSYLIDGEYSLRYVVWSESIPVSMFMNSSDDWLRKIKQVAKL